MKRTLASKTSSEMGKTVKIKGWVDSIRSHGKIVFVDVKDRSGLVQCVFEPDSESYEKAKDLRKEYVVTIEGEVKERPENMVNEDMVSGDIEVKGEK